MLELANSPFRRISRLFLIAYSPRSKILWRRWKSKAFFSSLFLSLIWVRNIISLSRFKGAEERASENKRGRQKLLKKCRRGWWPVSIDFFNGLWSILASSAPFICSISTEFYFWYDYNIKVLHIGKTELEAKHIAKPYRPQVWIRVSTISVKLIRSISILNWDRVEII